MTVRELVDLLNGLGQPDAEVAFLCPDGYGDVVDYVAPEPIVPPTRNEITLSGYVLAKYEIPPGLVPNIDEAIKNAKAQGLGR